METVESEDESAPAAAASSKVMFLKPSCIHARGNLALSVCAERKEGQGVF